MIAGSIEIQMEADLVRLAADMNKANTMVADAMDSISKAVDVAKFALGALAGVASVASFKQMISGAIDAAEALHDLSLQTGVSVESLSGLVKVGVTTDTTAQTIAAAMGRMAKGMASAGDEGKGVGLAIEALGIDFETFRQLKPDDQLITVAQAMAKFEDGSGKAAVAMTLWGKSGAALIPYMTDLAAAGSLVATVTTDQAEQADAYNDAMAVSHERVENLKRQLALGLLPAMIDIQDLTRSLGKAITDYLSEGPKEAGNSFDFMGKVIAGTGTVLEAIIVLASDVGYVFKSVGKELGGFAAQAAALVTGNFKQVAAIHDEMVADAAKSRSELDKFQASVLGTTDRLLQSRDALKNHSISTAENNRELTSLGTRHGAVQKSALDYSAATEKASAAEKAAAAEAKKLDEAYKKVKDSITDKTGAMLAEDSAGVKLTAGQQFALKIMQDIQTGTLKLTDARKREVTALLEQMLATEELKLWHDAERKVVEETRKEYDQHTTALYKNADGIEQQVTKQLEENAAIGKTKEQLELLGIERLNEQIRVAQAIVDADAMAGECNKETVAHQQTLEALQNLSAARGEGVHLKLAQETSDAWTKTADGIYTKVTGAILNGTSVGKALFDEMKNYAVDTFAKTVLQPLVKDVVSPFLDLWRDAVSYISKDVIQPIIKNVWETFKGWFSAAAQWITGDTITPTFSTGSLDSWLGLFKSGLESVLGWFGTSWSGIFDSLSTGWSALFGEGSGGWLGTIGGLASAASGNKTAGGGVGGGVLGAASNVSTANNLYNMLSGSAAVYGSAAAYGAALGTTSIGAGSQAAMLAAQTGPFGAQGLYATWQAAQGAGTVAGATAPVAAAATPTVAAAPVATESAGLGAAGGISLTAMAAFAAMAAIIYFGEKDSDTWAGGFASTDPNRLTADQFHWDWSNIQEGMPERVIDARAFMEEHGPWDDAAEKMIAATTATYEKLAAAFGGTVGKLTASAFLESNVNPGGDAGNLLAFNAKLNGANVYGDASGLSTLTDKSDEALLAAAADVSMQAVLKALQATVFSDSRIDAMIDAITATSAADIQAALNTVAQYQADLAKAVGEGKKSPSSAAGNGESALSADTGLTWSALSTGAAVQGEAMVSLQGDSVAELKSLRNEVAAMKSDNSIENTGLAMIMKQIERVLTRVAGGEENPGDALSVRVLA